MKFEEKLGKLDQLADEIKKEDTDLEKCVNLYEEAMKLSRDIESDLSKLERRIEIATSAPEDQNLKLEDYIE